MNELANALELIKAYKIRVTDLENIAEDFIYFGRPDKDEVLWLQTRSKFWAIKGKEVQRGESSIYDSERP